MIKGKKLAIKNCTFKAYDIWLELPPPLIVENLFGSVKEVSKFHLVIRLVMSLLRGKEVGGCKEHTEKNLQSLLTLYSYSPRADSGEHSELWDLQPVSKYSMSGLLQSVRCRWLWNHQLQTAPVPSRLSLWEMWRVLESLISSSLLCLGATLLP